MLHQLREVVERQLEVLHRPVYLIELLQSRSKFKLIFAKALPQLGVSSIIDIAPFSAPERTAVATSDALIAFAESS